MEFKEYKEYKECKECKECKTIAKSCTFVWHSSHSPALLNS
jgi:hypothetical protein